MPSGRFGRVDACLRRLPDGPCRMVEVGVFRGAMSAQLLKAHPGLVLYMVDNWAPAREQPEAYRATRDSHAGLTATQQNRNARAAYRATNFAGDRRICIREGSVNAAHLVGPEPLDLGFLDGDHSCEGTTADIDAWLPRIRPGGWIGGHDYEFYPPGNRYAFRVFEAVNATAERHGWNVEKDVDSTWWVQV